MSDRDRSRSPAPRDRDQDRTEPTRKKQKTGGFKWKEKAPRNPTDGTNSNDRGDSGALSRGYRDRSPRRDSYRSDRRDDNDRRNSPPRRERAEKPSSAPSTSGTTSKDGAAAKEKKPKKPKTVAPTEPMIIVSVNDRLGTKAQIPCLASDSVKAFKAIVAANIGRQPHEIMLKRQGERPFKDQLTLEDYGVSNGVQLDLEIDTGD